MCGRFTRKMTAREVYDLYGVTEPVPSSAHEPRYNGAPTQDFAVCRADDDGTRRISELRWGLVPSWWRDAGMGPPLINARVETVIERRVFSDAFRERRCLVPANGWFEWQGPARAKQPCYLALADGSPLSFAGIWERWETQREVIESFAILTTRAVASLADIHHRQPAILAPEWFSEWLDPSTEAQRLLEKVSNPWPGPYERRTVSARVNSVRNDDPDILRPVGEQLRLI